MGKQELSAGATTRTEELVPIDMKTGGGFLARAGASIKTTPEGKVGFLESQFGAGNVKTMTDGEIVIRNPENPKQWVQFDEEGLGVKDFTADIVGPAIEVAPVLAAGRDPATVALAGAAGNAMRQGVSALLPGDDKMSIGDRTLSAATTGVVTGVLQVGVNAGAVVFDAIRNLGTKQVAKAAATNFGKAGKLLEEKTGIPLTAGQATGSRAMLQAEALAGRTTAVQRFYDFHQKQLRTAVIKIKDQLDNITPTGKGDFQVGEDIVKAFDDVAEKAIDLRRAQATVDFGEVTRVSNGTNVIPSKNLVGEIKNIIRELDVPGAGDATAGIVNSAKQTLEGLVDESGVQFLSGEGTARLLQIYTNAQKGTGVLFKDMERSQSRMVAGRLKDALLADLDEVVEAGGLSGQVGAAVKAARDNYRANSVAVNELADSTLSRLIGNRTKSSEAIAEKFRKMHPSEIKTSMAIIEKSSPEAGAAVRRAFVEAALRNAAPPPSQGTAAGVKFSASRFLSNLPDGEILRATNFTGKDIKEIGRLAKVLERISDKEFQGSPTAFASITWDAVRAVFTLNPVTMARLAGTVIVPQKIANAALTPQGRAALMTLAETSGITKKTIVALAALGYLNATEPAGQDVRPMEKQP